MFGNITEERYDCLSMCWAEETSDLDSMDWRDDLTEEESKLVASWDKAFNLGVKSLCQQILHHECECAIKMHIPELHV